MNIPLVTIILNNKKIINFYSIYDIKDSNEEKGVVNVLLNKYKDIKKIYVKGIKVREE